ncbi:hypothetical protein ACFFX1_01415 [Dactylosporangium sucinum]|uniref:Uncharacterized protein n=1 Tax=Dactylosporangium sucinum TaxID=1424081 RepID=A0A917WJR1_9ACTN|nr:hypothetical protein [Dactylosporangium sucinum]GGM09239.1 hypothetical protein GCM10007977_007960 [Dactylosporangium sucinum]
MRRAVLAAAVVVASVPPAAAPAGAAPSGRAVQAAEVCRIDDPAVTEVSGLAVVPGGFLVENDSNPDPRRTRLFYLDEGCRVTRSVGYPTTARDPEDLAVDRSGTVWVADIGDNSPLMGGSGNRRSTIALWTLKPGAKSPKIHRLRYPDGEPRDAEALLIDGAGRPVIVTKEPGGEVYRLDTPLPTDNTEGAPLTLVGHFQPSRTGTANPLGVFGSALITGAAVSPDGTKAVVRTYSDAYEFDVTGGDVAAAIVGGTPVVTPLPNEPQGEAIAYTADGNGFLTVSDQPGPVSIQHYPATRKASPVPAKPAPGTAAEAFPPRERPERQGRLALLVSAFSVVGLMLVAAAARYARRR